MRRRKISSAAGLFLITLMLILSIFLLGLSEITDDAILQTIILLASMGLVFFSTHPLAHYIAARLYGVNVPYFFLSPSDFRNLDFQIAKILGSKIPTVGTKLDRESLSRLGPKERGRIFGVGAIASSLLIVLPLIYAITARFALLALSLGAVFFIVTIGTELTLSTKVGDLAKMKRESSGK
ncbi:MAG: hypothetical protein ACYC7D_09915 [Nitrososphaerales archaeon]